ncbi:hypothetical protein LINGRAHAP2_LOCUS31476 [Linum grandiflorum]
MNRCLYDPNCEHKLLQLKEGLRFKDANQFRKAVVEYIIVIGTDITWVRSSERKKETVCRQRYRWRIYASWYRRNRAFVIKTMGVPLSWSRFLRMKQMNAR